MRVLTLTMARDEAALIPYFVRHYMQLGDVVVFDDNSTDDTASIARAEGAKVMPVEGQEQDHIEERIIRAKNHAWKPVRDHYDWIIAVDSDEFLYHENMPWVLQTGLDQGYTVLTPMGYQMVSDRFPSGPDPITTQIRNGVPEAMYSKSCCFQPRRIAEINYCVGAHYAAPTGDVHLVAFPDLKLLHYRYLSLDWITARHANRVRWQAAYVIPEGWCHYDETPEQLEAIFAGLMAQATEVV